MSFKHIVLAYSGGLDTSAALRYLKDTYGCKVSAFCANLGQKEDWGKLEKRALASGADAFEVQDLRRHFIEGFVFPALRANARYEHHYLLGTPLARPAIVEGMIEYAHRVGGDALAHGCTPKGNDQVRFELAALLLDKDLPTVAPWRLWDMKSREDLLEYCKQKNVPISHSSDDLFSHDENLVHLTTEGEYLEEIENPFQWRHASWITPPSKAPDQVRRVAITFRRGEPIAVDGELLSPVDLVTRLNAIGAENGVGLQDIVENRINGMKVRGVFENPALVILHESHQALECATMSGEVQRIRDMLVSEYSQIIYKGLWFSSERKAIQTLVDYSQEHVTGSVLVDLYRGSCKAAAISSERSLYSRDLVTLHRGIDFSGEDATGFLRTMSLRYRLEADRAARAGKDVKDVESLPAHWAVGKPR